VGGAADPTVFTVGGGAVSITGTKAVSGTFTVGSTVTYTIVLTNGGTVAQQDNPGDEFTDTLPPTLTLVSADDGGNPGTIGGAGNTVTWNGSIPGGGGSVTITITATINAGTAGQTICNQGTFNFDADNDGTNESTGTTEPPGEGNGGGETCFEVVGPGPGPGPGFDPEIPTVSELGLVALGLGLLLAAWSVLRRRRTTA
jgi:fimbrial isopeptide formation D2 family protein